jgi:hypothetical protein
MNNMISILPIKSIANNTTDYLASFRLSTLRYAFHPTVPLPFARRSALPLRIPAAGKLLPGLLLRISNMKQKPVRARMGALYS